MFIQKVIHVGILKAPSNAKCISASVIILNYKNIRGGGGETIPNEHVQFLSKYRPSSHEHHLLFIHSSLTLQYIYTAIQHTSLRLWIFNKKRQHVFAQLDYVYKLNLWIVGFLVINKLIQYDSLLYDWKMNIVNYWCSYA